MNPIILFSVLFFIFQNIFCLGQKKLRCDSLLQKKLENISKDFHGQVGIYVENLETGKFAALNQDSLFPTASMIKVPIMVGIFSKILDGKIKYSDELLYRDSAKYDNGITGSLKDSTIVPLGEAILLMETLSDNTASLWLQSLAGGEKINNLMDSLGLFSIKVNSRVKGREAFRKIFGWGMTSPKDMAILMKKLRMGNVLSKDASNRMFRTLGNQYWDGEGLSQIPEYVKTACKTGAVDKSRSEVTFVHAPSGDYMYCIVTKNQKDTTYKRDNEGFTLIRNVSALIYNHFEPKSNWKPVNGYEKWY